MRRLSVDFSKRCIGDDNSLRNGLNRLLLFQDRVCKSGVPRLMKVPSIVIEESESSLLSIPRAAMPSLDLTHMRHMASGYSSTQPVLAQQDRLYVRGRSHSESDDESESRGRTWSNLGAPDSQIATSAVQSELYRPPTS